MLSENHSTACTHESLRLGERLGLHVALTHGCVKYLPNIAVSLSAHHTLSEQWYM
jgi:hypothetical protein